MGSMGGGQDKEPCETRPETKEFSQRVLRMGVADGEEDGRGGRIRWFHGDPLCLTGAHCISTSEGLSVPPGNQGSVKHR